MSKIVEMNKRIEKDVVGGYKAIEEGVVGGYKAIEEGVVEGYKSIEDKFIGAFLAKEGESVAEARARMSGQPQPAAKEVADEEVAAAAVENEE